MNTKAYESPRVLYEALSANGTRVQPPSNAEELIRAIESTTSELTRSELTVAFKEAFTVTTYLLWLSYRAKLREQRRNANFAATASAGRKRSADGERKLADDESACNGYGNATVKSEKITKPNCVPDYAKHCSSGVIRSAATLFCISGGGFAASVVAGAREAIKIRAVLYALYNDDGLTTGAMVERLMGMSRNELRQLPLPGPDKSYTNKSQQMLVQTLMELSETLADKSYGKLAAALNEDMYIALTQIYIKHGVFATVYPYEHLFQRYLKECVAPKRIDEEQRKIQKQFAVDPKSIITFVLAELQEAGERRSQKRAKRSTGGLQEQHAVFVERETYEVFRGPLNYRNDLVMRNVRHGDRFYWVITYNDCLYDVIGSSVDPKSAEQATATAAGGAAGERDMRLYNHLPWSSRLKLIPFRGKITLQSMTGEALNRFQGAASLTVSWMENGYETNRTVNVRNDGKRTAAAAAPIAPHQINV